MSKTQLLLITAAVLCGLCSDAAALEAKVPAGFAAEIREINGSGGFDYLPDGDIIALSADFAGPTLAIFDANGDGQPAQPQTLAVFDGFTFGSFVKTSPDGTFVLFATSGTVEALQRVDLADLSVATVLNQRGLYDVAFIDNARVYLSGNPGGFDPSVPNSIYYLDLADVSSLTVVAQIADTPSGAVALNSKGDLYYIRGTYSFPAPPGSFALLRFAEADLAQARQSGVPLSDSQSQVNVPLDNGFDLEINRFNEQSNDIYISLTGPVVLATSEAALKPEPFLTLSDDGSEPAGTYLAFSRPGGRFVADGPVDSRLGAAVASDFFSSFSLFETTPLPKDSDHDGVLDIVELEDGSDPLDRGSFQQRLKSPVFALWNGFLNMTNILELINNGSTQLDVTVSLLTIDGTLGGRQQLQLQPGQQFDVIVNDFPGFAADSYGLIKLEYQGELGGRVSVYRPNLSPTAGDDLFDFVYRVALQNGTTGRSLVAFNTFQPSLNLAERFNAVDNWLSLVNLGAVAQTFLVRKFDQQGVLLSSQEIAVAAGARIDVEAGHVVPGPGRVGTLVVDPFDAEGKYLAQLIRYGRGSDAGYEFAFALTARAPTGRPIVSPVTSAKGAQGWLELINGRELPTEVSVNCYGESGDGVFSQGVELAAFSQLHFNVSAVLPEGSSGHCIAAAGAAESVVAQQMEYYRDTVSGSMTAMSGVELREALGATVFGSYNLYLGMENTLRVSNPAPVQSVARLEVFAGAGSTVHELVLAPFETRLLAFHNASIFQTAADTYGVVSIERVSGSTVIAETERSRERFDGALDFVISTAVR